MDEVAMLDCAPAELRQDVMRVLNVSPLFGRLLKHADETFCRSLFRSQSTAVLPGRDWAAGAASDNLVECMRQLRLRKQTGLAHVLWWELGLRADIESSASAVSALADSLIDQAVKAAALLLAPRYGQLENSAFAVIGLGKLGGEELNFGSDVDLLFVWRGQGDTSGGRTEVSASEYYRQLSRMLIRLLDEPTADGVVWPVDMRLRPGGDAGPICLSLDATLTHYQEYGQTWERAMLIKARAVAGDLALGEELIQQLSPFVYKRYLDYTNVAALAEMKRRIDAQAGKHGIEVGFDVKRGSGGIREVEFCIQSMQLVYGGQNKVLQVSPSMLALQSLVALDLISEQERDELAGSYWFWRRIEHAIQAREGEQTQKLPVSYTDYLHAATGMEDVQAQMLAHASRVHTYFSARFAAIEAPEINWLSVKEADIPLEDVDKRARIYMALQLIRNELARGLLPDRSYTSVETILSVAVPEWLNDENGATALEAFAKLLHSIAGRATWVDLLANHPGCLRWLIGVLATSQYIAYKIAENPSWLEWPLESGQSEERMRRLMKRLNRLLDEADCDDEEVYLAELGRLVDHARLLCALAIDAHTAQPATIGGWLADVADCAVQGVQRLALHKNKLPQDFPFVALAMGKHGSREMGLVSDLDMVFVLAGEHDEGEIHGRSYQEWAQRLGRRMIQYLCTKPPYGAGYEMDTRLRPSGEGGVLVTTRTGFEDYQLHEAQTWEHQALCRARAVSGPQQARLEMMRVVEQVLARPRDARSLAADVLSMREKMLEHLSSKNALQINLKHDAGGLVDIEFLAQFARLYFAVQSNATMDVLRAIPATAPSCWQTNAPQLADIYCEYRRMENALRVQLWRSIGALPADPDATEWETMRRHAAIQSPEELLEKMQWVRSRFDMLLAVDDWDKAK